MHWGECTTALKAARQLEDLVIGEEMENHGLSRQLDHPWLRNLLFAPNHEAAGDSKCTEWNEVFDHGSAKAASQVVLAFGFGAVAKKSGKEKCALHGPPIEAVKILLWDTVLGLAKPGGSHSVCGSWCTAPIRVGRSG